MQSGVSNRSAGAWPPLSVMRNGALGSLSRSGYSITQLLCFVKTGSQSPVAEPETVKGQGDRWRNLFSPWIDGHEGDAGYDIHLHNQGRGAGCFRGLMSMNYVAPRPSAASRRPQDKVVAGPGASPGGEPVANFDEEQTPIGGRPSQP